MPLALVLFLFFPRLPGAFWALPQDERAITGLGDEMSPGSISRAVESDEPAMRVRFEGPAATAAERYWRGPVLHDFDGYTWRARPGAFARRPTWNSPARAYRYDVTLEPSSHDVLLALELPSQRAHAVRVAHRRLPAGHAAPASIASRNYALSVRIRLRARTGNRCPTLARRIDLALPRGAQSAHACAGAASCAPRAAERPRLRRRGPGSFPRRRLRIHADAAAARRATPSTICCSARAQGSAAISPRRSSR